MAINYCGGIPEMPKADIVEVVALPDSIKVIRGFKKGIVIPYKDMASVSMKTDEQISKDVTLTRVLALGIFALGAKKTTKTVTNYLLIDYNSSGVECTAVFTGDKLPKVVSQIAKARQNYLKSTGDNSPAVNIDQPDFEFSDIEKMVIAQYRSKPELQEAVCRLLGVEA